jgi:hypothetical protein
VVAPSVIESGASGSGGNFTVTGAVNAAVSDIVAVFRSNDFYTAAALPAPTSAQVGGAWTSYAPTESAVNGMTMQLWIGSVTTGGAPISFNLATPTNDGSYCGWLLLRGCTGVDGTPVGAFNNTADVNHTFASTSPVNTDSLLVCCGVAGNNGVIDYVVGASGLTKIAEYDGPPFSSTAVMTQQLSTAGATGTRATTVTAARKFAGITAAFAGSAVAPYSSGGRFLPFFG